MRMKNVLIVEDDARIAAILAKTINKREEYEVIGVASNVTEAIDVIDCFAPDLVFLDISLDSSCGLDVIKYIRQEIKDNAPTVVMLTAAKDVEVIQKSVASGVFDYILKPISFSRLSQTLQRFSDYSDKLETRRAFEQEDVDLFFGLQHGEAQGTGAEISEKSPLPKGVDGLTLEKIIKVFRRDLAISYTAEGMADCIGLSRTTARRYLEYLLSVDRVKADIEYGTVGRPERRYIFI
ncbi:response regulator [Shewanella violacea]|uniref:Transcriptional regulatory protein n=1 Tax=Shewanella violacea (strain JCM 10179 / CIP 106290 / LMG 19151 / DSS12) TaxID=637905 RepID=D4ZBL4_SHEVD|nr:response regulator [Shewanella violacea]BAJ03409.1 response regulator [Shewanella violacea DSS12]